MDNKQQAKKDKINYVTPYLLQFFNIKLIQKSDDVTNNLALSCTLNALIEAVNAGNMRLPKYIIVAMDRDILDDIDVGDPDAERMLPILVTWFVRQINTVLRRKCMDLLEKRPGAISGCLTKVIYVRMLRPIGKFDKHTMLVNGLRSKFNDALNDAVAKIEEYMLTVSSYHQCEHYDHKGRLSEKGKKSIFCGD